MGRFRVSNSAYQDIEEIWSYIAADNPAVADRVIRHLHEAIQWLARFPAAAIEEAIWATAPCYFGWKADTRLFIAGWVNSLKSMPSCMAAAIFPAVLQDRADDLRD